MTGSDRPFMSTPVSESSVGTATLRRVRPQVRPLRQTHFAISPGALIALIMSGALAVGFLAVGDAPSPVQLNVPLMAHLSGLLAGYGVAVMLMLMSRAPALERGVGADRLARWHAAGGRANLALIWLHAVYATIGWVQVTGAGIGVAT